MDTPSFSLERPDREVLQITLRDALTEAAALRCEHEVRSAVAESRPGSLRVLIDVRAVHDYELSAREVLVRIITHLLGKSARTAFLADTPHSRALALWIAHMNNGNSSNVIDDPEIASAWLLDVPEVSGVHALESQPPASIAK